MKFYICSDIHGAAPKLGALLAMIGSELDGGKAKLVVLGDIYNHGPRNPLPEGYAPMEVANALNARKDAVIAVKGNCDSEIDETISEFNIYLFSTVEIGGRKIVFTHGHKCNPAMPDKSLKAGDIVFYGHEHRVDHRLIEGVHYVCVGGLGMAAAGSKPSYAVFEGNKVAVYSIDDGSSLLSFELQ